VTFRNLTPSGAWWRESQSVFAFFLSFLCCSTAARRCWWQLLLLLADARSIIPLFSLHATFISSHSIHHRRLSFMFIWTNVHSRTFSLRRISPELVLRSVCLSLALSRSLSLHRRSHFQAAALGAPPAAAAGRRAVQPAPTVSSFSLLPAGARHVVAFLLLRVRVRRRRRRVAAVRRASPSARPMASAHAHTHTHTRCCDLMQSHCSRVSQLALPPLPSSPRRRRLDVAAL
jgi:hypothetical protein